MNYLINYLKILNLGIFLLYLTNILLILISIEIQANYTLVQT